MIRTDDLDAIQYALITGADDEGILEVWEATVEDLATVRRDLDLARSGDRFSWSRLLAELGLCPLHECDVQICEEDEDRTCAGIRWAFGFDGCTAETQPEGLCFCFICASDEDA